MLLRIVIAIAVGLPIGAVMSWNVVRAERPVAAVRVGAWVTYPGEGRVDADPYLRARTAARGAVPLGAAEGIVFTAATDSTGAPLDRECDYRLTGALPPARMWTLQAATPAQTIPAASAPASAREPGSFVSRSALRDAGNDPSIAIGPTPRSGNWLAVSSSGPLELVLRLYDAPIAADPGLFVPVMPTVERFGPCVSGAQTGVSLSREAAPTSAPAPASPQTGN